MNELVLPSYTNSLGTVFGGQIMAWIDVCAALAAMRHARTQCVTASMDALDFIVPIEVGHVVNLRAMVNFVEFLATISTPPRARIELVNIPHLDRSFHKNVEAALEPYFQGNVEVEPTPGRVDILFTEPDPQWGEWATLPVLDGTP